MNVNNVSAVVIRRLVLYQITFQSIKSIDKSASIDSDFNLKSTLPNDNILRDTYEKILVSLNNIKSHRETYLELLNNWK